VVNQHGVLIAGHLRYALALRDAFIVPNVGREHCLGPVTVARGVSSALRKYLSESQYGWRNPDAAADPDTARRA
jgi:hypothetical protein